MDYTVAICDDSEADRRYVSALVTKWAAQALAAVRISEYVSAESLLFDWDGGSGRDILLLDIEMGGMDGMALAKHVRRDGVRAEIVFITSHFEFVAEGYEVDALHYLMKPVSEKKLFEVLDKAAARLSAEPPSVVVSFDGETVKLIEADILYAEAFAHYLEIHARSGIYRVKEGITAFADRLSADFYRAHRSYLVNLKAVERISRASVALAGGAEIPLSRGKYDDINRAFIERN